MTAVLPRIDAAGLKRRLAAGDVVLFDIREPAEHARERIPGARLAPLSRLDRHPFDTEGHKVAVFHCKGGSRTAANAARLAALGFREAYLLEGGLEAWKKAGLPVEENRAAPIDLQRQVMIAAGGLVLTGLVLATVVAPAFAAFSALVGAGLVFAGVTGFCGMARLLALMPWNRRWNA